MTKQSDLNLYQRLAQAMGKVDYIQKEKKQGMRYSIVSHDAVTAKVRPALLEAGVIYHVSSLSFEQMGNRTQCHVVVSFVNVDDPREKLETQSFGYGIDDQDKGPGKAMSYAVKYALLKTLGLETGDDPDHEQEVTYNNPLVATIELGISLALDNDGLNEMSAQIKELTKELSQAELAMLRQKFLARKAELAQ